MDKVNCSDCRHFDLQNNFQLGLCRRYPAYVNRSPKEWCGVFAVAEKVTLALAQPVKVFSDLPDTIDNLVAMAELTEKRKPGRPKLSRRQIV